MQLSDLLIVGVPLAVLVWAALSLIGIGRERSRPSSFEEEEAP